MNERSMRPWLTELADENEALRADIKVLKAEIEAITGLIGHIEDDVAKLQEDRRE